MKILCYNQSRDAKIFNLIRPLQEVKECTVGNCGVDIDQQSIDQFNPDLIIHDMPNVDSFPYKTRALSININDHNGKNCFSVNNPEAKNYIKPFVSIRPISQEANKYTSDIVYIGNPSAFGKETVSEIISLDYNFKFFSEQPLNICGYCGCCYPEEYFSLYSYSKACIVVQNDVMRIMDIVVANGNPVIYSGDPKVFIDKIKDAVLNNTKYTVDNYDKQTVKSRHTNYDRISYILNTIGLTKLGDKVLQAKKKAML